MDTIIVISIIIIAVVYIVWTFYKSQKTDSHDGSGCGSHKGGCTGCGAHHKGVNSGVSKNNSKDMKTDVQIKRKQLKHSAF